MLTTYFQCHIETVGSGRTDTGVHAIQQFCHFDAPTEVDQAEFKYKVNSMLPADIALVAVYKVPPNAHARFDAISRSYQYHISRNKNPFRQQTSYNFWVNLDVEKMNNACRIMLGERDFKSFSKVKTSVEHFRCKLTEARWEADNESYRFYVSANRFLRGMVRSMVGTLIDLGTGKIDANRFHEIIDFKDRRLAGRSAPAEGLFLTRVEYPDGLLNNS